MMPFPQFMPDLARTLIQAGLLTLSFTLPANSLAADLASATVAPPSADAAGELLAQQQAFQRQIEQLEADDNTSAAELSEAYGGLGTTLQRLDQHAEAVEVLEKAIGELRVANGLKDAQQLPLLEQKLQSYEALEQWEDVDATHYLIHHIASRAYPIQSMPRFEAVASLARWKLRAARESLLPGILDPALEASLLYTAEINKRKSEATYSDQQFQLASLYINLAAVEFLQARTKWAQPLTAYGLSGPSTVTEQQCQAVRTNDGRTVQFCTSQEVPNINYFLSPTERKGVEVGGHLNTMEISVQQAVMLLQKAPTRSGPYSELFTEMNLLATEYNEFIKMATPRTGTLLKPKATKPQAAEH